MEEFIKERNEAFASMDEEKIIAYCKKYSIAVPEDKEVFWTGVHKAVCNLYLNNSDVISLEQYNKSYEWLAKHGSTPSIQ